MTREESLLIEKLKELSEVPWIIEAAVVTEVDEENLTCTVTLLKDDTEIPNVRLKAGVDGVKDGMVQIPSLESSVLVATINNDIQTRFVVAFSSVEKVLFYGGSFGGIVKWPDAKTELDKVKDMLEALINVIGGPPINEPGSGSPSAFQTALKSATTGKELPNFEDLEDEKVKH